MDEVTKREIIMENYMHPTNRRRTDDNTYTKTNTKNASCIDNLDIYIRFKGNVIDDIVFVEGIVYSDIYKQGNRKTCATLPFRGLEKVILDSLK